MDTVVGVVAVLPATSVAVPVTVWFLPSVVTVVSPRQLAMPEPASAHANETCTGVLFQPSPLGSGSWFATMVGAVLSIDTVAVLADSTLPALSTLHAVIVCMPSEVRLMTVPSCCAPPSTV